jgi:hypothetical protein
VHLARQFCMFAGGAPFIGRLIATPQRPLLQKYSAVSVRSSFELKARHEFPQAPQ